MSQFPLQCVEPDQISPSRKQRRTKFPADPETDVVAKDRSARGRRNNVPYVQRMFVAGKCCSTDQDCFPRQRNTSPDITSRHLHGFFSPVDCCDEPLCNGPREFSFEREGNRPVTKVIRDGISRAACLPSPRSCGPGSALPAAR